MFINQKFLQCNVDKVSALIAYQSLKRIYQGKKRPRCHPLNALQMNSSSYSKRSGIFMVNTELIECLPGATESQDGSAVE